VECLYKRVLERTFYIGWALVSGLRKFKKVRLCSVIDAVRKNGMRLMLYIGNSHLH
jgi:hypothetical protein